MKMNHMLFKVAQLEETLVNKLEVGGTIDKIVAQAQLKTLEFFKNHPIRSHEEANELLERMNLVFGLN